MSTGIPLNILMIYDKDLNFNQYLNKTYPPGLISPLICGCPDFAVDVRACRADSLRLCRTPATLCAVEPPLRGFHYSDHRCAVMLSAHSSTRHGTRSEVMSSADLYELGPELHE